MYKHARIPIYLQFSAIAMSVPTVRCGEATRSHRVRGISSSYDIIKLAIYAHNTHRCGSFISFRHAARGFGGRKLADKEKKTLPLSLNEWISNIILLDITKNNTTKLTDFLQVGPCRPLPPSPCLQQCACVALWSNYIAGLCSADCTLGKGP